MQTLGATVLASELRRRYGENYGISETLALCESNPTIELSCRQNSDFLLKLMKQKISPFEDIRTDVGESGYYDHVKRTSQGVAYLYQAVRAGQDGPYPVFRIEPLFGSADLETQLAIEENYDEIYDSTNAFHYQQPIIVSGTPLPENSTGWLVKRSHYTIHDDEIVRDTPADHILLDEITIDALSSILAKDMLIEIEKLEESDGPRSAYNYGTRPSYEQMQEMGLQIPYLYQLTLGYSKPEERLGILKQYITAMISYKISKADSTVCTIELGYQMDDEEWGRFTYNFHSGKYVTSSGIETNRENLNAKMISCLNAGCTSTADYWFPFIYEFLGSPNITDEDFWWDVDRMRRAKYSVNGFAWAERIVAQRRAYVNYDWMTQMKYLLTGQIHRYQVKFPEPQEYLSHEKVLQATPIIKDPKEHMTYAFEVYGQRPLSGQIGIILQYTLNRAYAEDAFYLTQYDEMHNDVPLVFLGPDEAAILKVVKKYCVILHRRTIKGVWVNSEEYAEGEFNPWQPNEDGLILGDQYEYGDYGKPLPDAQTMVKEEILNFGLNSWAAELWNGRQQMFDIVNEFTIYRVRF